MKHLRAVAMSLEPRLNAEERRLSVMPPMDREPALIQFVLRVCHSVCMSFCD